MRSLLFALLALALSGCSTTWPESASLNPIINDQPDTILPQGTRIKVDSNDTRVGSQIIKIKLKGEPEVLIPNNVAPATLLADRLAKGYAKQGAIITNDADNHLTLGIEQLQAEVTKPGLVYKTRIAIRVKLNAEHNGSHITKEYRKSAMQETATLPDTGDIEVMLNEQIATLLNEMLGDSQVRNYIRSGN